MNIEELVTDLATSRQLRDKGFPQDTAMVWIKTAWGLHVVENSDPVNRSFTLCAAPTAGELEEWLFVKGYDVDTTKKHYGDYVVGASKVDKRVFSGYKETHVAALAALLICDG